MKIDWKRVHEKRPLARYVAWHRVGICWSFNEKPYVDGIVWKSVSKSGDEWGLEELHGKCPGAWDKTIIEFPGHYDDVKPSNTLAELSASLHAKAAEGKDAANRARKVDAAIAAVDAFLKSHGKTLDAAGVEVVFNVRDGG